MKIIVSAACLSSALERSVLCRTTDTSQEVPVILNQNRIMFDTTAGWLHVEAEEKKNWEYITRIEHLVRLKAILKNVPDQPITLRFADSGHWISIFMEV